MVAKMTRIYVACVLTCVAGVLLSANAAAQGGADPAGGAMAGLIIYGPLGVFCGWLMWRDRVRESEHRAEREAAWQGVGKVVERLGEVKEELVAIRTSIQERDSR